MKISEEMPRKCAWQESKPRRSEGKEGKGRGTDGEIDVPNAVTARYRQLAGAVVAGAAAPTTVASAGVIIDAAAASLGTTRSGFLAEAARTAIKDV